MIDKDDAAYLKARELEEREAAAKASCMVKDVHLELAGEYENRAREVAHAADQIRKPTGRPFPDADR